MDAKQLDVALAAHDAGICVVRVKTDGSKMPMSVPGWGQLDKATGEIKAGWKRFQTERPTREMVSSWFTKGHPGIGFITGAVSGNLVMLELEGRAVEEGIGKQLVKAATDAGHRELIHRLANGYNETTPSGGVHFLYRLSDGVMPANIKLAMRPATEAELVEDPKSTAKTLIETRGEGGFTVAAPSHGKVHPTGNAWTMTAGGVATIPTLTSEEQSVLFGLCKGLSSVKPSEPPKPPKPVRDKINTGSYTGTIGASWYDAVIEHLAATVTMAALLERHGWKLSHGDYYTRPGKDHGVSGTINANDRLIVFSSSTPFKEYKGEGLAPSYDRLDVIAMYEHGNDRDAAATYIARTTGIKAAWHAEQIAYAAGNNDGSVNIPESQSIDTVGSTEIEWVLAGVDGIRYTDLGNAHRLINARGDHLRFVPAWKKWMAYDGGRWRDDHADTIVSHLAYSISAQLCTEENMDIASNDQVGDTWTANGVNIDAAKRVKQLIAWTMRSESSAGVDGTISAASSIPGVAIDHEAFDAHPWLLNVANGTVDLRTGTLEDHNPNDLLMMQTAVKYDATATAPVFTKFIETVLPDADVRRFVQQLMGLVLVGEQVEHLLCIAIGGGANGKSTLTRIIANVLGEYAVVASKDLLLALKHDTHPTAKASLFRKRFAHSGELPQGAKLDEAQVKELTGNDRIKARRMREDEWEFTASHLLWLHANHRPNIVGTDDGIWRRVQLIPFSVQIPEEERDSQLVNKITDGEGPGVLNWMLDGLADYRTNKLVIPDIVRDGTKSYRNESDTIAGFMSECDVTVEPTLSMSANELMAAHNGWFNNAVIGEETERGHYQRLLSHLKTSGVSRKRRNGGDVWLGVGIAA